MAATAHAAPAAHDDHHHHGPPEANRSSRVTPAMLGMMLFIISEIVISTLPEDTSKWVADKLVERVQASTNLPVEHIESQATAEASA